MLSTRFETLEVIERVRPLLKGLSGERTVVPGIVVVGAQSGGKSSVLEHATGLGFPRGEGMCTRVPTVVSVQGGCPEPSLAVSLDPEFGEGVDDQGEDDPSCDAWFFGEDPTEEKMQRTASPEKAPCLAHSDPLAALTSVC